MENEGLRNALPQYDRRSPTWRWQAGWVRLARRMDHILYTRDLDCGAVFRLKEMGRRSRDPGVMAPLVSSLLDKKSLHFHTSPSERASHSKPMSTRVSIVEDSPEVRDSVIRFLASSPGFTCVGAYPSGEEALQDIPHNLPNVVLMDINLPGISGIECVARLKAQLPALQVIMLTVYEDSEQVFQALTAGACGYLVKSTPPEKILEAIHDVQAGGSPMSSHIARKVVQSFLKAPPPAQASERLSEREEKVLQCLAKGWAYKQIADQMAISMDTVRTYIRRIYEKLHVHSRTEAVIKYLGAPGSGRS